MKLTLNKDMLNILDYITESYLSGKTPIDGLVVTMNNALGSTYAYQDAYGRGDLAGKCFLFTSNERKGLMFTCGENVVKKIDYWDHIRITPNGYPVTPTRSVDVPPGTDANTVVEIVRKLVSGTNEANENDDGLPPIKNGEPVQYQITPEENKNKSIETKNSSRQVTPEMLKGILQDKLMGMLQDDFDGLLLHGTPGIGKATTLDTGVLTPKGWVKMGDIKVFDTVVTPNGETAVVNGVFPQKNLDVWRVTFKDGRYIDCCEDHLWVVYKKSHGEEKPYVMTTKHISEEGLRRGSERIINEGKNTSFRFKVKCITPYDFSTNNDLPIAPYALGVLIGDGCLSYTVNGKITYVSSNELDVMQKLNKALGDNYIIEKSKGKNYTHVVRFKGEGVSPLNNALKSLKLNILDSKKFIPEEYHYTSASNRLDLLKGLMDTDGSVATNGSFSYSTKSKKLAKDVQKLCWSLGYTCSLKEYDRKEKGIDCDVCIQTNDIIFSSNKHIDRFNKHKSTDNAKSVRKENFNQIVSITKTGECVKMQCISVLHDSHQYVVENYIPTHNTFPVKKFLKEHNIKFRKYSGTITTAGLFMALWENRQKNKWLLFDDIDSVFKDEASRNLLKAALDSARDERVISYKSKTGSFNAEGMSDAEMEKAVKDSGGRKYPDQFLYQGKIIFISNLETSQIEAAILSRTQKVNYCLTTAQIWDLTESMMNSFEIARNPPPSVRKYVLELMKANWKLQEKPSFRVYMSACATFMRVYKNTGSNSEATNMVLYEIGGLS